MSSTTAAAVIAIEDEQLLTLAQTGIARELSVGGRRVLGQDVASSGRDDPAPTRTRQYEQGAGSPGVHKPLASNPPSGLTCWAPSLTISTASVPLVTAALLGLPRMID